MKYLRGALVELMPTGLVPVPNIIVFQYNPESMSHVWTQPEAPRPGPGQTTPNPNPLKVAGNPGESFTFTLMLDAADSIADNAAAAVLAQASGVYSRLAALEMLLYPASSTTGGLLGTVSAAAARAPGSNPARAIPDSTINTVLFVWGAGRIVPVRVTSLTITEKLYDPLLNPIKAEVQITLRVLTDEELRFDNDAVGSLARAASAYSDGLRKALAIANLVNASESTIGMIGG